MIRYGWLHAGHAHVVCADEGVQLVVFERGGLLFVANLHPTATVQEYTVRLSAAYSNLVLSTDDAMWGGRSRTIYMRPGATRGDTVLAVPPCCMFVAN
jgi:1,4-alpha-glucan branching enzyme